MIISRIKDLLLDFLFPKSSRVITLESLSAGELLGKLPEARELDEVIALFDYRHTLVKEIIWEIKYAGNSVLAKTLGTILYDVILQDLIEKDILSKHSKIILIPMPVSDYRRAERGWNQAELLAKAIKEEDKSNLFKYLPHQLVKFRHTESQTKTRDKEERMRNLNNSMKVLHPPSVTGEFVVLVDDVITTGSTFTEARRTLKEARVKRILCVAIAH